MTLARGRGCTFAELAQGIDDCIEQTVKWYIDNFDWVHSVSKGKYSRERLGLMV